MNHHHHKERKLEEINKLTSIQISVSGKRWRRHQLVVGCNCITTITELFPSSGRLISRQQIENKHNHLLRRRHESGVAATQHLFQGPRRRLPGDGECQAEAGSFVRSEC